MHLLVYYNKPWTAAPRYGFDGWQVLTYFTINNKKLKEMF